MQGFQRFVQSKQNKTTTKTPSLSIRIRQSLFQHKVSTFLGIIAGCNTLWSIKTTQILWQFSGKKKVLPKARQKQHRCCLGCLLHCPRNIYNNKQFKYESFKSINLSSLNTKFSRQMQIGEYFENSLNKLNKELWTKWTKDKHWWLLTELTSEIRVQTWKYPQIGGC